MIAAMSFKGLHLPYNPETLKIVHKKEENAHCVPYSNARLEVLGRRPRIISGEGELFGDDRLNTYNELLRLFYHNSSGLLAVDGVASVYASFTSFELLRSAVDKVIKYRFSFTEAVRQGEACKELSHKVKSGETLWHIANFYDVSIDSLVQKNPQIMDINELEEGSVVRL